MSALSFFDVAAIFVETSLEVVAAEHEALEKSAQLVEKRAKAIIGHYQDDTGPFDKWADLADSTIADKTAQGYAPPDNPLLRDGSMRDSIEHTTGAHTALVGSDSDIAVYQELGTHGPGVGPSGYHVPPRSFLGAAAFQKEDEVAEMLGIAALEMVFNGTPLKTIK